MCEGKTCEALKHRDGGGSSPVLQGVSKCARHRSREKKETRGKKRTGGLA